MTITAICTALASSIGWSEPHGTRSGSEDRLADEITDREVIHMSRPTKRLSGAGALAVLGLAAVLAGCGGGNSTPIALKIGVSEQGKEASFSLPKSVEGGLAEVTLTNEGKAPHGLQFVRYTGDHTAKEVIEEISGESEKTPDWIRGEGGIGSVAGGQTATATLNLEAGKFLITDAAEMEGKPAIAEMTVTEGDEGDLPDTDGTVTAEETGKDKYAWDVSGLKAGKQQITFESEGDEAIHLIIAVPVKGKAPSLDKIKEDFSKEGPPPPYIDFEAAQSTAVLDGGKSQTTPIDLKSGEYIFFCPLADRDGGKPHDEEGLLAVEKVE